MKAGEKERVGALRLVLSELQKAAKEGEDDEVAVLRRERKRRLDAAEQYRDGGRADLADQEEGEAELIAGYLPAELSDEELEAIVAEAVAESGAARGQGHGQGHGDRDARRSAGAPTASASPRRCGRRLVRRQIELANEVAAGLAGSQDAILKALEGHLDCERLPARQRASRSRATRRPSAAGETVVRELADLIAQGHEIAPGTIEAVTQRAGPARVARRDPRGRRLAPPQPARRAQDAQPEALRRLDPPQHDHLRHRPGGHGQDLPGRGHGGAPRCRGARSTASSSPAPRSRPASGWASCPAT